MTVCIGVLAVVIEQTGEPRAIPSFSPWLRVGYRAILYMTVMGLIYNGVGFSVVLTGQNLSTLTRCKIILGVVLLAMIFADVFHRVVGISVFGQIYDAIFFLVGGGYTAKVRRVSGE